MACKTSRGRLIIDLTSVLVYLQKYRHLTGLQRVALTLSRHLYELARDDMRFVCFDRRIRQYIELSEPEFLWDLNELARWTQEQNLVLSRSRNIEKYKHRPVKKIFHTSINSIDKFFYSNFHSKKSGFNYFEIERGDKFVFIVRDMADYDYLDYLYQQNKEKMDVGIYFVIHDLIPIRLIGFEPGHVATTMENWLDHILELASGLLVLSEQTQADLLSHLNKRQSAAPPMHKFPLAHQFECWDKTASLDRSDPVFSEDYILSVGSQTGRKNGSRLLAAWRRLEGRLPAGKVPHLVLAGASPDNPQLRAAIDSPGRKPILVTYPTDTDLQWLYRHCLFTAYPSCYEGWGLPVGESFWFGKPCAASQATSIPEVGGGLADYFDPFDIDSIATCLEKLILDDAYREARAASIGCAHLRSWSASAGQLLAAIDAIEQDRRHIS